jgi:hypothetical protein
MSRRSMVVGWTCVLVVAAALVASAQPGVAPIRVLVVDETKTFDSTMRVAGLVGALRSVGMFDVGVALADVTSSYDDPLAGREPDEGEELYDLIVVLPRGLDDGSIRQIWIVSAGLDDLSPSVAAGLDIVADVLDQVFAGIGEAIDVSEDLWPCLLWAVYSTNGWIR